MSFSGRVRMCLFLIEDRQNLSEAHFVDTLLRQCHCGEAIVHSAGERICRSLLDSFPLYFHLFTPHSARTTSRACRCGEAFLDTDIII